MVGRVVKGGEKIRANIANWSAKSKERTLIYDLYENYRDLRLTCCECGQAFIFPAKLQKIWYEVWKVYIEVVPIRCPECFPAWHKLRKAQRRLSLADKAYRQHQTDKQVCLRLASAIAEYHAITGQGDLQLMKRLRKRFLDDA